MFSPNKFSIDLFKGKNSIFAPKISEDLFLVISAVSLDFIYPRLFRTKNFRFFSVRTCDNSFLDENVYFAQKISVFSVRTCDNTTSPHIGGADAWAVPHLKFGATVPQPP